MIFTFIAMMKAINKNEVNEDVLEWKDILFILRVRGKNANRMVECIACLQVFSMFTWKKGIRQLYSNQLRNEIGKGVGIYIYTQCGRPGFNPSAGKSPWRRKWQPTPVFLPGKSHGQRSLAGCSPWGGKESDMTEQLRFTSCVYIYIINI